MPDGRISPVPMTPPRLPRLKCAQGPAHDAGMAARSARLRFVRLVARALRRTGRHDTHERDLDTVRRQYLELETLHAVSQRAAGLDLDATLREAVAALRRMTGADSAAIWLWRPDTELLEAAAVSLDVSAYPDGYEARMRQDPRRLGEGLTGLVAERREPLLVADMRSDPRALNRISRGIGARTAVFAPIVVEDRLLGVLRGMRVGTASFGPDELRVAVTLANTVALAVAAAQAHAEMARRAEALATIHEVMQHAARADLDESIRTAVDGVRRLVGADSSALWLWQPERERLEIAHLSFEPALYPPDYEALLRAYPYRLGEGVTGWVAERREPLLVADLSSDGRRMARIYDAIPPRAGVFAPLVSEGQLVGVLRGLKLGSRSFTEDDLRRVTTLADGVALGIVAAQADRQRLDRMAELEHLHETSVRLSEAGTPEEALQTIVEGAVRMVGAEAGVILRRTEERHLPIAATANVDLAAIERRSSELRTTARTVDAGEAVITTDLRQGGRMRWAQDLGMRSVISIPLRSAAATIGALHVAHSTPGRLDHGHVRQLQVLASQAAAAIARAEAFEETRRASITDRLTGCYNARFVADRLGEEVDRARRYGRPLVLMMIDSDSLKLVNDRFGHVSGDRHLVELAGAIRDSIRSTDVVARYGGDEFLVLQPETGQEEALATAERIRAGFHSRRFSADDGQRIEVSVSIGVAGFPESAGSADELFRQADLAMYAVKHRGKNAVSAAPLLASPTTRADGSRAEAGLSGGASGRGDGGGVAGE